MGLNGSIPFLFSGPRRGLVLSSPLGAQEVFFASVKAEQKDQFNRKPLLAGGPEGNVLHFYSPPALLERNRHYGEPLVDVIRLSPERRPRPLDRTGHSGLSIETAHQNFVQHMEKEALRNDGALLPTCLASFVDASPVERFPIVRRARDF